jgi:predicted phosphodiesterase
VTKTAVLADVHGRLGNLRRIIAACSGRVDRIVVVGDYLEAKVSKKRAALGGEWTLEEVVDPDPELWELLAESCLLVRGNQEERIAALLAGQPLPAALAPLLAAPAEHRSGDDVFCHGHGFDWWKTAEGPWCPVLPPAAPPAARWFFGHSHRRLLVDTGGTDGSSYRALTQPETGTPLPVPGGDHGEDPAEDRSGDPGGDLGSGAGRGPWLVNCGAVFHDAAHWTLYDDETATVTYLTAETP